MKMVFLTNYKKDVIYFISYSNINIVYFILKENEPDEFLERLNIYQNMLHFNLQIMFLLENF